MILFCILHYLDKIVEILMIKDHTNIQKKLHDLYKLLITIDKIKYNTLQI